MDFGKIFISFILVIAYIILFGLESIEKLLQKEMTISHSEKEPQKIEAPGMYVELEQSLKKIVKPNSKPRSQQTPKSN